MTFSTDKWQRAICQAISLESWVHL
uniref:Uncharacterized protein n=1 Tax=Anguilla anguilla TaxID=7936 RepID=A0A0E9T9E8_ANGAN